MINKIADKIGSGGVWLATLSCTACFPVLGSLTSALGLGFLSSFEGIAVNTLLPVFASVALLANLYNWSTYLLYIVKPIGNTSCKI